MKCDYVLVNPPKLENHKKAIDDVCLGIGYINAVASQTHKGMILNAYLNDWSVDDTVDKILELDPEVIGLSCNFYTSLPPTVKIVNKLRERNYKGHISIGGHGAVSCKDKMLEFLDIDSLALGDGEISFSQLVTQIVNKTFKQDIDGFYYKSGDEIISDYAKVSLVDIENLPYPTRVNEETYPLEVGKDVDDRTHLISTSRGCTYRCVYCDVAAFYNKTRRIRSVESVVAEIKHLVETTGVNQFAFSDDNFIGGTREGRKRALEFCGAIKREKLDIEFAMEARVTDMINEVLLPLRDAGLKHVNIGVESASQRMLNTWKKGIKVEQSEQAIKKIQTLGLSYNINFILYDMYTTIDELWEIYRFFVKTKIVEYSEEFISIFSNALGVLAGTPIANELKESDIIDDFVLEYTTNEEQEILDKYKPIYGYKIIDKNMACFKENHDYWIEQISQMIIDNNLDFFSYSTKSMRILCLKLFKKSIENGEKGIVDKESLDKLINKVRKIKSYA
ncbi:radical SAM protein [Clostridiaceae bacterium M8S5]|nr:radical SAM protein [Clostridiaceae bacterium M8S5]